ncbi:MAG: PAS domain S-box protein [Anaerolineaceae bacterium]|nr:PAS domain S-box protein [Anaerolineaceae bacterium]
MPLAEPLIIQDTNRLKALRNLCLLDTPADPAFDRLTKLVTRILHVPVALVVLVDANRQFFKSQVGVPEPWATMRETPLSHSFCQHVVATGDPLIIENARKHDLVYDNLAIRDLDVISYAGIPLKLDTGEVVGSFCAIDSQPRTWTDSDISILIDLAASVMTEIELRTELRERERIEAQLRESEHFVNEILTTAPDIIYVFDTIEKRNIFVNHDIMDFLGYTPKQIQDMGSQIMANLVHPDDLPNRLKRMERAQNIDDFEVQESEHRVRHSDGTYRWLHTHEKAFKRMADGNVAQLIGVARDITVLKQAEEQALQLALEKDKVEVLSSFMRKTSHDFRTPLTVMNSSLYLLVKDNDPERRQKRAETMQVQINFLTNLVNELQTFVDLTQIENFVVASANVNNIVKEIVQLTEEAAHEKNVSFELRPAAELPLVEAESRQLRNALSRIIDNAIVYSPAGGKISMSTSADAYNVIIEIKDNGAGISDEDLPHIFDLFYKGDKARTHGASSQGAGIGLAMVKQIVEMHHGQVKVESKLGEGSCFRVYLPIFTVEPQLVSA